MSTLPQTGGHYRAIVIGSGLAGLFAAIEASSLGPVLVLTKAALDDGSTSWAQGGIAAAIGPGDSPEQHLADTIAAGAGLVDETMARILVESAPRRIRDLERYGVDFDSDDARQRAFGREGAHRYARVLHARGDRTGAAIAAALALRVAGGTVTVREHTLATGIVKEAGCAAGVRTLARDGVAEQTFEAPAIVLATGGAGAAFSHTTNPPVATGDGIGLAFAAGAEVADLEFYQFHPTAFRKVGAPPFLISEALRGEGAVLRDHDGRAFMPRYHDLADLAPRDVVARAMLAEMRAAGTDHVWLDCTPLAVDPVERFPAIAAFCGEHGVDLRRQPVPVAPAAHYLMGGVRTDAWARTTVPGLYACGETAATGVHGANRLASNSLLETAVFAKRAVEHIASGEGGAMPPYARSRPFTPGDRVPPQRGAVRRLLWEHAGIERSGTGLRAGLEAAGGWPAAAPEATRAWHERRWLATFAELLLTAALTREESRGAHFRTDFPERDDARWARRQVFHRDG